MSKKTIKLIDAKTITATETGPATPVGGLKELGFFLDASSVGGTSPTFDFVIEVAPDSSGPFATGVAFTQIAADATEKKVLTEEKGVNYVRYKVTVGGTSPTGAFTLTAAGVSVKREPE